LRFYRWFDVPIYGSDGIYVIIIGDDFNDTLDFIGAGGALNNGRGIQSEWFEERYSLSAYPAGDTIQVRIAFVSDNDGDVGEGVYIDDVIVEHPPDVAPSAPHITRAQKSGTGIELIWNAVIADTLGYPEMMDYYVVYRDTSLSFIPEASDSIGVVFCPDTSYIDEGILSAGTNCNYLVIGVDWLKKKSKKSNMAYVFNKFINENPGDAIDRNWVSLPYNSEYDCVRDLTDDLSPSGTPIGKISRLEPKSQNYYSWIYHPVLGWYGNDPNDANFPIEGGVAYEMIAVTDDTVIFVGANEPDGLVRLDENTGGDVDRNWVSIPYNAVYDSVRDITDELSPGGEPLRKITMLDVNQQVFYSWIYHSVLNWYGNHPVTPNFSIEAGDGYEFVVTRDTTWNPTEYTNDPGAAFLVRGQGERTDIEIQAGSSREPSRTPTWGIFQTERRVDYADAHAYRPVAGRAKRDEEIRELGISHIVYVDLALEGYEDLLFTVYRPHLPYDVLTEQSVGCVIAQHQGVYCLLSFDVGNLRQPWFDGEEMILIVEAIKEGRGYFAAVDFVLDSGIALQRVDEISLIPIPEPGVQRSSVRWDEVKNSNVVGYSLYHGERRVNECIITDHRYAVRSDVTVRPVIRGGYETVYGSRECARDNRTIGVPMAYAFTLFPNPCAAQLHIEYSVPQQTEVSVVIYDVSGRRVNTLISHVHEPGYYSAQWYGVDDSGREVSSGIYFMQFRAGSFKSQEKIMLVKSGLR
jgi:hypothetical protein